MSEVVRRRCRDHVGDERGLRTALLEDLRTLVPFDFHVWLLVDPESEVGTAPLASVPDALTADLAAVIRNRYLTRLGRWDEIDDVASLDQAAAGRRDESRFHREVLAPNDIGDVASVAFRDVHGCWGFLELWRRADAPSFSDGELGRLADAAGPITTALRVCQARSFDEPGPLELPPGPAVLFLAPDLQVVGSTPSTDAHLRALLPTDGGKRPVPAGAFNVAAALVAHEAGEFPHPPRARTRPAGGTWLTFSAARVDGNRAPDERDIAVAITASTPAERRALYVRAHGLTPREREVVDRLADGRDTSAIADALFVSEHTVQDHLKSVFAKTGARNRRTLLARANGR